MNRADRAFIDVSGKGNGAGDGIQLNIKYLVFNFK